MLDSSSFTEIKKINCFHVFHLIKSLRHIKRIRQLISKTLFCINFVNESISIITFPKHVDIIIQFDVTCCKYCLIGNGTDCAIFEIKHDEKLGSDCNDTAMHLNVIVL